MREYGLIEEGLRPLPVSSSYPLTTGPGVMHVETQSVRQWHVTVLAIAVQELMLIIVHSGH